MNCVVKIPLAMRGFKSYKCFTVPLIKLWAFLSPSEMKALEDIDAEVFFMLINPWLLTEVISSSLDWEKEYIEN